MFDRKDPFSVLANVSLCCHPSNKSFHTFTAPTYPASPYFLPIAVYCPLKVLNQTLPMCSAPRQQKPAPVAGKVAAATHTIDAANAKIGMPGSTSWKRDRNAPRNKLQPLSLPLQALSSTALKEEVRPLAKRNQLGLPGSASLASTSTASADWRGTAG